MGAEAIRKEYGGLQRKSNSLAVLSDFYVYTKIVK